MGKNLHIMQDNKFFAGLINEIKSKDLENDNLFAIKYYQENSKLIYINTLTETYNNYILIDKKYNLEKISKGCSKIIFHNLFNEDITQLSRFKKNRRKVYWRQWTGDSLRLLNLSNIFNNNFLDHIYIDNIRKKIKNDKLFDIIKRLFLLLFKIKHYRSYNNAQIALKKIDYAMNWYELETNYLKKNYSEFNAKYLYHNYFKPQKITETFFDENRLTPITNLKILLGHNGHPDTNYIDAINLLYNILKDSSIPINVSCILSYGNKSYIEKVISYGKKVLEENFNPITTFMSTDKYYEFTLSHDVFIFNSNRPVGAHNIFQVMKRGAKVYLNPNNPIFDYFTKMGVKCFSILSLKNNTDDLFVPMTKSDKNKNIDILNELVENQLEMYEYSIKQIIL